MILKMNNSNKTKDTVSKLQTAIPNHQLKCWMIFSLCLKEIVLRKRYQLYLIIHSITINILRIHFKLLWNQIEVKLCILFKKLLESLIAVIKFLHHSNCYSFSSQQVLVTRLPVQRIKPSQTAHNKYRTLCRLLKNKIQALVK